MVYLDSVREWRWFREIVARVSALGQVMGRVMDHKGQDLELDFPALVLVSLVPGIPMSTAGRMGGQLDKSSSSILFGAKLVLQVASMLQIWMSRQMSYTKLPWI